MNINNRIENCTQCMLYGQIGACGVNNSISKNTTIEEFEINRTSAKLRDPKYRLVSGSCGISALSKAAEVGNIPLICHIINEGKKEGKNPLDYGDFYGVTPLFHVAYLGNDQALKSAKELLKLGAKVNLATSRAFNSNKNGVTPAGSTPLFAACENSQNIKLAKLLLQNGGMLRTGTLTENGEKTHKKAKLKVAQERIFLAGWYKQPDNKDSLVRKLPKELVKIILDYIRCPSQ